MDPVKDFYENYYSLVFSNKGISSFFNSLTHKALELRQKKNQTILEIALLTMAAKKMLLSTLLRTLSLGVLMRVF